jgi:hypothetical protein
MGLDQYAKTATKRGLKLREEIKAIENYEERENFRRDNRWEDEIQEIQYWRKHADLNEWMTQLAVKKGIVEDAHDFNCVDMELTPADIDALERDLTEDALPHGAGFFWGRSQPEDRVDDESFIVKARQAFAEGKAVFYSCWY